MLPKQRQAEDEWSFNGGLWRVCEGPEIGPVGPLPRSLNSLRFFRLGKVVSFLGQVVRKALFPARASPLGELRSLWHLRNPEDFKTLFLRIIIISSSLIITLSFEDLQRRPFPNCVTFRKNLRIYFGPIYIYLPARKLYLHSCTVSVRWTSARPLITQTLDIFRNISHICESFKIWCTCVWYFQQIARNNIRKLIYVCIGTYTRTYVYKLQR